MKSIGMQGQDQGSDSGVINFKDQDFERIIEAMVFDQKIERNSEGYYVAVNFSFPFSLNSIDS